MTDFEKRILQMVEDLKAKGKEPHGDLRELAIDIMAKGGAK